MYRRAPRLGDHDTTAVLLVHSVTMETFVGAHGTAGGRFRLQITKPLIIFITQLELMMAFQPFFAHSDQFALVAFQEHFVALF